MYRAGIEREDLREVFRCCVADQAKTP
jgi:hypothetical protein